MSSSEAFTVLLVPGSWHVPGHYKPLIEELHSKQIPTSALLLPTCSVSNASVLDLKHPGPAGPRPSEPWPDMYADAKAIGDKLFELVEAENLVLLVAHSYGGLPASEALLPELCRETRAKNGMRGGVIGSLPWRRSFFPLE